VGEMLKEQLYFVKKANLYEIYTDAEDTETFAVGYIREIYPDFLLLETYDRTGNFDGFRFILVENIYMIKEKTQYLNRFEEIEPASATLPTWDAGMEVLDKIIFWLCEEHILFEMETFEGEILVGYMESYHSGVIKIKHIGANDLKADGWAYIMRDSISEISIETCRLAIIK
jgi:hypothetical protein